MTLAQLIAQARRDAGMTQQQLADAMGASRSLIAQWESGAKRELQWETVCRIADATNKNINYFREDKKVKKIIASIHGNDDALEDIIYFEMDTETFEVTASNGDEVTYGSSCKSEQDAIDIVYGQWHTWSTFERAE